MKAVHRVLCHCLAWSLGLFFLIAGWGLIAPVAVASGSSDLDAETIFRSAYENRYTWDEHFPGYQTEVVLQSGSGTYRGVAELLPDFGVIVKEIPDEEMQQVIAAQLQMSATHLQRVDFDQVHPQRSFQLTGTDAAGASEIAELDGATNSHYKVKDREIIQVNRTLGNLAVEVNTTDFQQTPDGYLATHFQVTFRDAKTGATLEQDDVQDTYSRIGNYYIMTRRQIQAGQDDPAENTVASTNIQFNRIQLK